MHNHFIIWQLRFRWLPKAPPGHGLENWVTDYGMCWKRHVSKAAQRSQFPVLIGSFGEATPHVKRRNNSHLSVPLYHAIGKNEGTTELSSSDYYYTKYGVQYNRAVRFPGIISNVTPPGGGTTDYAVDIFYSAVKGEKFVCPLKPGTYMDMMYMPDAPAMQAHFDCRSGLSAAPPPLRLVSQAPWSRSSRGKQALIPCM